MDQKFYRSSKKDINFFDKSKEHTKKVYIINYTIVKFYNNRFKILPKIFQTYSFYYKCFS